MKGVEINVSVPGSGEVCDFCSDPRIFARYPARDFRAAAVPGPGGNLNLNSQGDWAACKACTDLVETGAWQALEDRSATCFRQKYTALPVPESTLRGFIRDLHKQFRQNRQFTQ